MLTFPSYKQWWWFQDEKKESGHITGGVSTIVLGRFIQGLI